ncbi:hypothetical protein BD309DRAFT_132978 [Dichomitus squalens]|nr:hypothetical protein BD309DRAFT_132978 [Dichomitus squalens]
MANHPCRFATKSSLSPGPGMAGCLEQTESEHDCDDLVLGFGLGGRQRDGRAGRAILRDTCQNTGSLFLAQRLRHKN